MRPNQAKYENKTNKFDNFLDYMQQEVEAAETNTSEVWFAPIVGDFTVTGRLW